jgi:hypothetical protein
MLSRCVALLIAAIALEGCCVSGSGCYAPVAPAGPVAWDGLGPISADENDGDHQPRRRTSPKTEIVVGPLNGQVAPAVAQPPVKDWDRQQAAGQDADAKLNGQLKICRGC